MRKIPPFNLEDKYANLDDLVLYINNNSGIHSFYNKDKDREKEKEKPKAKKQNSTTQSKPKGKKKKQKTKNPDEALIEKFKRNLEQQSVPIHRVNKIETFLNKDWLNSIHSN